VLAELLTVEETDVECAARRSERLCGRARLARWEADL
jgi:hypothetical protein